MDRNYFKTYECVAQNKVGDMAIAEYSDEGYNQGGFYSRMRTVAIRNGKSNITSGERLRIHATETGVFQYNGEPLQILDCGRELTKTERMEKQQADYQVFKRVEQEKAAREAMKARDIADKKQAAAARALKVNQDAAAKGDMFGLLRMGERYRDGDGVEKDLGKAREYLQKAADAGSPTAKEELANLKAK
jgi:TPR repeat protein